MIPRNLRLSRGGFERARRLPRAGSAHFSLTYGEREPDAGIAVVVPKKAAKRAVDRHRLKRRLRAILAPYAIPGRLLIVHAKPGVADLPFPELAHELSQLVLGILPRL